MKAASVGVVGLEAGQGEAVAEAGRPLGTEVKRLLALDKEGHDVARWFAERGVVGVGLLLPPSWSRSGNVSVSSPTSASSPSSIANL